MGLETADGQNRLQAYLAGVANSAVELTNLAKLSGGAIQENWALDVRVEAGDWSGEHQLVLRQDSASKVATSLTRANEFHLLKAAKAAGVQVPTPCFLCEDESVLGRPFFVMHRLSGTAAGHVLTKGAAKPEVVMSLGTNLAHIHSIAVGHPDLAFLEEPPDHPALYSVKQYRGYLDDIGARQPAIEFGLAWLERNAPQTSAVALSHRDYRTGNIMIDGDQVSGVLDWEFAGWSDPMEDIGWFCAKCWRFGAYDKEAGGLGEREDFYRAYEQASGRTIRREAIAYWEVMAHVRWAVIACQQAARHQSGEEISLELALTAYVVPELEYEILKMTEVG